MFPVEPGILLLFCLTELAFSASPGVAVFMVVSRAMSGGMAAAMASAAGVLCGNLLYFALSATVVGAFLFALREWFFVAQWCGAAYLLYLASAMFFGGQKSERRVSRGKAFGESFAAQLANPKTIVFFIAFLPLFINPEKSAAAQIAVLAAASFAVELCVLFCYAFAAQKFAAVPGIRSQNAAKIGALLLCCAAASLAFVGPE